MLNNITNIVVGLARRAQSSDSSSTDEPEDSDVDAAILADATEEFRNRINAASRVTRVWLSLVENFTCVFDAQDERRVIAGQFARCGLNFELLTNRGEHWGNQGIVKRYYKCAYADTCNCPFMFRVVFNTGRGTASIEQPAGENCHNDHVNPNQGVQMRATAEQRVLIDQLVATGCKPKQIFRRLQETGSVGALTLS